jgi:hypothetical protein
MKMKVVLVTQREVDQFYIRELIRLSSEMLRRDDVMRNEVNYKVRPLICELVKREFWRSIQTRFRDVCVELERRKQLSADECEVTRRQRH